MSDGVWGFFYLRSAVRSSLGFMHLFSPVDFRKCDKFFTFIKTYFFHHVVKTAAIVSKVQERRCWKALIYSRQLNAPNIPVVYLVSNTMYNSYRDFSLFYAVDSNDDESFFFKTM